MKGPNPESIFPNKNIKSLCFIKNVVKKPNIIVGNYTYYDDINGAEKFEQRVTHHYDFVGDKLIIGKFCAIAKDIEFAMNGENHRMDSITTIFFTLWEMIEIKLYHQLMNFLSRVTRLLGMTFG